MVLIDVHCHLDFKSLDNEREQLIKNLEENNIIAFSNTLNKENYLYTKKLFNKTKNVRVCPGLYPTDAEKLNEKEIEDYLDFLKKDLDNFEFIGEIGLDAHYTKDENLLKKQEVAFRKILDFAVKYDKGVCIHTRDAEKKVLEILKEYVSKYNFKKIDLHCFLGGDNYFPMIKELGVFCSIPLTLLSNKKFQRLVKFLPLNKILVETDSPFLHYKGRDIINTPLNIPLIYDKIAELKGVDKKELENIIYNNYLNFTN